MAVGVKTMNETLVQIGSGIAIALGIVHFASTKPALRDFKELAFDSHRMLRAIWNGIGFMVIHLGAVPLALTLLGAYTGTCATVVGLSAVILTGVLAVSDLTAHWPTKLPMGKVAPVIFAAIAILIGLGTFL